MPVVIGGVRAAGEDTFVWVAGLSWCWWYWWVLGRGGLSETDTVAMVTEQQGVVYGWQSVLTFVCPCVWPSICQSLYLSTCVSTVYMYI